MFTVKQGSYSYTINCDPSEFIWMRIHEELDEFVYKYPDVPELRLTAKIPGSIKEPRVQDSCPNVGDTWFQTPTVRRWVVAYVDWNDGAWTASTQGSSPEINPITCQFDIVKGPYFNAKDVESGAFIHQPTL